MGWTTKFRFTARTGNFVFLHSVQIGFKISQLPIQKLSPLKCLECKTNSWFIFFFFGATAPSGAKASSFTKFLDHTHRRVTVARNPLDEWSARRIDLHLTTHNIHNRQDIHAPGRIRTHKFSRRGAAYLHFRQRGHWDWRFHLLPKLKLLTNVLTAACTPAWGND